MYTFRLWFYCTLCFAYGWFCWNMHADCIFIQVNERYGSQLCLPDDYSGVCKSGRNLLKAEDIVSTFQVQYEGLRYYMVFYNVHNIHYNHWQIGSVCTRWRSVARQPLCDWHSPWRQSHCENKQGRLPLSEGDHHCRRVGPQAAQETRGGATTQGKGLALSMNGVCKINS